MTLSPDEGISAAIRKLRAFIVYHQDPEATAFEHQDEGPFPPLGSAETKILCGEIIRAIREGEPFPPAIDRAALGTAVYAVKHNPAGFEHARVGAILDQALHAFTVAPHPTQAAKLARLLELVCRAWGTLARRAARPGPPAGAEGAAPSLEDAAGEVAALLADAATPKLPGAGELREACAELTTRAYGPGDLDRLCRLFEKHAAALAAAAPPGAPGGPPGGAEP